jgi:hypothetical protein
MPRGSGRQLYASTSTKVCAARMNAISVGSSAPSRVTGGLLFWQHNLSSLRGSVDAAGLVTRRPRLRCRDLRPNVAMSCAASTTHVTATHRGVRVRGWSSHILVCGANAHTRAVVNTANDHAIVMYGTPYRPMDAKKNLKFRKTAANPMVSTSTNNNAASDNRATPEPADTRTLPALLPRDNSTPPTPSGTIVASDTHTNAGSNAEPIASPTPPAHIDTALTSPSTAAVSGTARPARDGDAGLSQAEFASSLGFTRRPCMTRRVRRKRERAERSSRRGEQQDGGDHLDGDESHG